MSKSASPTSKSVGTTDAHPQERIARELLTQGRPLFLGVDGEGAAHYWDSYEFAVAVVVSEDHAEKVALAETPYETLAGWCEYTQDERGWAVGPYVGGSIVDDLARGLNA
ncbi:hypothetical protein HISP_17760 (plasmid) [Haloarcula hispanica N601]|uniref:Uncharacterized protein n=2 Tax=Haloarcula hispanica TaxID=51589 RepID=V5TRZ6_HALHI|nr:MULTISPECIES: hypothetical protein [Haloarcula]AEM58880.1 conserved hypothetical protein [Haloarcula hispanica ATCC 33960]AHB67918.1 hypothetical protein HISP_17760 [Haloarcula hispanica N601]RLM41414.1 hypothetical protein DVK00_19365 [Haloarcula sp. Atlit-47R]